MVSTDAPGMIETRGRCCQLKKICFYTSFRIPALSTSPATGLKFLFSPLLKKKIGAYEPIQICETYSHQTARHQTKDALTDIIHHIICRIQRLTIDRQCERTPERCFAPLKMRVHGYELSGDVVSCCWCDPCAKSGRGGHRRARELDTNGASARLGVVAV